MKLMVLFLLINQIILAQTFEISTDSCFCESSMKDTRNIFTEPTPLPNNLYDSLIIYVLPQKQVSNRNVYSNQSYRDYFIEDSNYVKYQKAVIANYSPDSIILKASYFPGIYIIQEALDTNNIWKPIEYLNFRKYCSVGEIKTYTLKPSEFCNVFIPRYCGKYKTKIRLKLITPNGNIYSTPFTGSINYEQIYLDPLKIVESHHFPRLFEHHNQKEDLKILNKSIKKNFSKKN